MNKEPYFKDLMSKIDLGIKFWLKFEKKNILGSGWARLLEKIDKNTSDNKKEAGSLTQAAKDCGYSYKYAWNILKRIEVRTGVSPVITGKGGRGGGGWIKLSEWGRFLIKIYRDYSLKVNEIEKDLRETMKNNY